MNVINLNLVNNSVTGTVHQQVGRAPVGSVSSICTVSLGLYALGRTITRNMVSNGLRNGFSGYELVVVTLPPCTLLG